MIHRRCVGKSGVIVLVVIDSCILIDWLKQRAPMVEILKPYLQRDAWLVCDLIRCEVLRGIKEPAQQRRMQELFSLARSVPMDAVFWDGVWSLGWKLDRAGTVLPLTDLCLAHLACSQRATLVTRDRHFANISGIVTAGSLPASH